MEHQILGAYGRNNRTVNYETLKQVPTPDPTKTWQPIPHTLVIDLVEQKLQALGFSIAERRFVLVDRSKRTEPGAWLFGLISLEPDELFPQGCVPIVGIRNCHDKVFSAGVCIGTEVTVCTNLDFSAEKVFARRHTRNILKDLEARIEDTLVSYPIYLDRSVKAISQYMGVSLNDDGN